MSGPAARGAPGAAPALRLSRLRTPPGPPAFAWGAAFGIPPLRRGRRAVALAGDSGRWGGGSQDASGEPPGPRGAAPGPGCGITGEINASCPCRGDTGQRFT